MKKWILGAVFAVCILVSAPVFSVCAQETKAAEEMGEDAGEIDDSLLEEIDLTDIEEFLGENEETKEVSFQELIRSLLSQEGQPDKKEVFSRIWQLAASELVESKGIFIQLLIMCAAFAVLHNFANVFENSQIHTTCFFMFYMALITLLMKSYLLIHQIITSVMSSLTEFMQVLLPAFCMALIFSGAMSTAAVFYQIVAAVIFLVENILVYIVVPAVHIYVVMQMLNYMTGGDMISHLTKLLRKIICWSLRIMVAAVAGINIIQNLIAPALDGLKNTAVTKALNMIPGIGGSANAVTSMFLGSAAVIKNGIGAAALIILLILCLGPVIKVAVLMLLYKLTGALVQPISDKRVCGCISSVGDGAALLLQVLVTAMMMFMVTIASVTAAVK